MAKVSLRSRLLADKDLVASGLFVFGAAAPASVEMAGLCGYDFVIVDEATVEECARAGDAHGISVLVRVDGPLSRRIGALLDTGVEGILVPMVDSAQEAQHAVDAALLPPEGRRGWSASSRANEFSLGDSSGGYGANRSPGYRERPFVGVFIETKGAVNDFDKILAVPHLDVVFPTTGDLRRSLRSPGMPEQEAEVLVEEAWTKLLQRYPRTDCPFLCVPVSRTLWNPDECRRRGVRLVTHPSNLQLLGGALKRALSDWRSS